MHTEFGDKHSSVTSVSSVPKSDSPYIYEESLRVRYIKCPGGDTSVQLSVRTLTTYSLPVSEPFIKPMKPRQLLCLGYRFSNTG